MANDDPFETSTSLLDAFGKSADDPPVKDAPIAIVSGGLGAFGPARGAIKVERERDETKILIKIGQLAERAGNEFYYRWPVRKKLKGVTVTEYVEGPTIKLANELARVYGNCEIETRIQDLGTSFLIYARFIDLESGFHMVRPFQQRTSQRVFSEQAAREDPDRQRDIQLQIGVSKAIRNVVVNALQYFADHALDKAKSGLLDRIKEAGGVEKYRGYALKRAEEHRIDVKRIEAVIGKPAKDWLAPDVALVVSSLKSVIDGMSSADETFPPLEEEEEKKPAKLDEFGQGATGASGASGAKQ